MKIPLIPQQDYIRIAMTIYSLLIGVKANIEQSCVWFSMFGSAVLERHYKLKPNIYMGIAAYMVDDVSNSVLIFAEKTGRNYLSSQDGYHCWIEVDGFVIDFSAPLFPLMVKNNDGQSLSEPKMFQKKIVSMADSISQLKTSGDFFMSTNTTLTNELMNKFMATPCIMDLANICCDWYRKPLLEMPKSVSISNESGITNNVPFQEICVSGAW